MKRKSSEYKSRAREMLLGNYSVPISAFILISLITILINLPFIYFNTGTSTMAIVISYVSDFFISLISSVLTVGYSYLILNMTRKKEYKSSDIFYAFKNQPDKFIIASTIISAICFIISLPLTIIATFDIEIFPTAMSPTIINVGISVITLIFTTYVRLILSQVYFIMIDNPGIAVTEAIKTSGRLMAGNVGRLIYIALSFIPLGILGIMSCYIGFLFVVPYIQATLVFFYLDLIGEYDIYNA